VRRIGSSIPNGSIAGMEGDGLGGFHAARFRFGRRPGGASHQ
jgi:hypothetical protein